MMPAVCTTTSMPPNSRSTWSNIAATGRLVGDVGLHHDARGARGDGRVADLLGTVPVADVVHGDRVAVARQPLDDGAADAP